MPVLHFVLMLVELVGTCIIVRYWQCLACINDHIADAMPLCHRIFIQLSVSIETLHLHRAGSYTQQCYQVVYVPGRCSLWHRDIHSGHKNRGIAPLDQVQNFTQFTKLSPPWNGSTVAMGKMALLWISNSEVKKELVFSEKSSVTDLFPYEMIWISTRRQHLPAQKGLRRMWCDVEFTQWSHACPPLSTLPEPSMHPKHPVSPPWPHKSQQSFPTKYKIIQSASKQEAIRESKSWGGGRRLLVVLRDISRGRKTMET